MPIDSFKKKKIFQIFAIPVILIPLIAATDAMAVSPESAGQPKPKIFNGQIELRPFKISIQNPRDNWLVEYVTHNLRRDLSRIPGILFQARENKAGIPANETEYGGSVEGTIDIDAEEIKVEILVLDATTQKLLLREKGQWKKDEGLFKKMDQLSTRIVGFMEKSLPETKKPAPGGEVKPQAQRQIRMLLLPFENLTGQKKYAWLRSSLRDWMRRRLEGDDRFRAYFLSKAQKKALDAGENPLIIARGAGYDGIIVTKYAVIGKTMRMETTVIAVDEGQVLHVEVVDGPVDSDIFSKIDSTSTVLITEIPKKIRIKAKPETVEEADEDDSDVAGTPPPQAEIPPNPVKPTVAEETPAEPAAEKSKRSFPELPVNFYLTNALPLAEVSNHLGYSMGLRSDARLRPFNWMGNFYSYAALQGFYSGGKTVSGMFFFAANLGLTYPVRIEQKYALLPHAAIGYSTGRLSYEAGYPFLLPSLDLGVTGEMPLFKDWHLAVSLTYYKLLDKYMNISFVQLHIGLGMVF